MLAKKEQFSSPYNMLQSIQLNLPIPQKVAAEYLLFGYQLILLFIAGNILFPIIYYLIDLTGANLLAKSTHQQSRDSIVKNV